MARHGEHVLGLEDGASARGSCGAPRSASGGRSPGSKSSVRPAAWIGWNVTPRTHGLLEREVDDPADLVVVQALLQRDDQRRGDVERVQPIEGAPAHVAQIGAAQLRSAARARASRTAGRPRSPACSSASRSANASSLAMRMPLVFTIRCWIGAAFAQSRTSKNCGWIVGSPPEICTTSGSPSLRTTASSRRSICSSVRYCWRAGPLPA